MLIVNKQKHKTPLKKIMYGNKEIWPGHNLRWYDREDWWNWCSCKDTYIRANHSDIGKVVKFYVYWGGSNLIYRARLIGINHDPITNGGGKRAHCTFAITTVWSDHGRNAIFKKWMDSNVATTYEGSIIRDYCNNTIYPALPAGLKAAIKQVDKTTRKSPDETSILVTLPEYVFSPSSNEFGRGDIDIDKSTHPNEGLCYEYYKEDAHSRRIMYDLNNTLQQYWLRTSLGKYGYLLAEYSVRYVATSGLVYGGDINDREIGILPLFCI